MAKKRNKNVQPVEGVFSDRPLVPKKVIEPVEPEVEENVVEPVDEEVPEDPVAEPIVEPIEEPVEERKEPATAVIYDEYKVPKDAKEKGIILTIILSILILLSLGFLIYYEHSWRLQEQEVNINVDSKYKDLVLLIRNYLHSVNDPNKAEYCSKFHTVYKEAAKASGPLDEVEENIRKEAREILGFNDPDREMTTEYVWQSLFGAAGLINTWLANNDIVVTKENQKEIFTAIAKGFE